MNKMDELDMVWGYYQQWLADCDQRIHERRRQLTFAEWLHTQYEAARKGAQGSGLNRHDPTVVGHPAVG